MGKDTTGRVNIPGWGMVPRGQIAKALTLLINIAIADIEAAAWTGSDTELFIGWQREADQIMEEVTA